MTALARTTRLVSLAALPLLMLACSSMPPYSVGLETVPGNPIPNKPMVLNVTLTGGASAGAVVDVEVAGTKTRLAPAPELPGVFTTDLFTLPNEGTHAVKIHVAIDGETGVWDASLVAACTQGGDVGAACCAPDACATGLTCVFGACAAAPAAPEARCHGATECGSGVCNAGTCAAPACDDGVKNGTEPAVDCGGGCATGCPTGTACLVDKDCAAGLCAQGTCPLGAGKLIGEGDAPKTQLTTILDSSLVGPTDLAFSTLDSNQLWIVDRPTDSFIVVFGPGQDGQSHNVIRDYSQHFMEEVTAISFADEPTFATCGDSQNTYGGQGKANYFMGPVQWPSKYSDYTAVQSAHSVHWDMLHSSPNCMGIASAGGTAYYTFNGYNGAIDWVDFKEPHCPGCDDHSDGVKRRYEGVSVKRVAGLPSNLVFDKDTSWLYVADSGNGRVLRLDTRNSTATKQIPAFLGDGTLTSFSKPTVQELSDGGALKVPSGLALDRGVLYVGDNETGVITAWKVSGAGGTSNFGEKIAEFNTGIAKGGLVGMTVGPDKKLYVVDRKGKRVLRLDP